MRYLVPALVLIAVVAVLSCAAPWPPRAQLVATLATVAVIAGDWLKTSWYERQVRARDEVITTIKGLCQVDQSVPELGAFSRD
jgi:hypothetical protein